MEKKNTHIARLGLNLYLTLSTGTKCKNIVLHIPFHQDKTGPTTKKGAHQLPTLKKNFTMVEPFAWSSGMAIVLIANLSMGWLRVLTKDLI